MTSLPASSQRGRLLQVFGLAFGLAIIIGSTIGVGILRAPGEVAARLPSPGWIAGALLGDWGNGWKSLVLLVASYPAFLVVRRARR